MTLKCSHVVVQRLEIRTEDDDEGDGRGPMRVTYATIGTEMRPAARTERSSKLQRAKARHAAQPLPGVAGPFAQDSDGTIFIFGALLSCEMGVKGFRFTGRSSGRVSQRHLAKTPSFLQVGR